MIIKTKVDSLYRNDRKMGKKVSELMFSKFFIDRFNHHYSLGYRVIANTKDAGDIDTHAISDNDEVLNLQLKTGEPGLERFWGTRIKKGSGMAIIDVNIEELLSQIIRKGESHYTDPKNLILLITERYQPVFDVNYALLISNKLGNTTFKGVYIVKLAAFDSQPPYEGQIVAIKDIFGNHGKIF